MRILLILPAYNEQDAILHTVSQISNTTFPPTLQVDYIVINDGSTDATERLCRENGIQCVSLIRNLGIGGAVQTGYLYALENDYDVAVQFDGDGQHDIASLSALLAPLEDDTLDFVVGSRFIARNGSFRSTALRRCGIRFLSALTHFVTGCRIEDVTSGYRAANRKAICFLAQHYPVDYPEPESLVHLIKNGFRVGEVSVNMFPRVSGSSSINSSRSLYYMCKVSLAILCAGFQKRGDLP